MSFWVAILARLDLRIYEFGRLPLYGLGLILTFNLGRDITVITLYPFIFGTLVVWCLDHYRTMRPRTTGRRDNKTTRPQDYRTGGLRTTELRTTGRRDYKTTGLQAIGRWDCGLWDSGLRDHGTTRLRDYGLLVAETARQWEREDEPGRTDG